jgi:hypothetical protein
LRLPAFGGAFDDDRVAAQFVRGLRNGILHEAETQGWVIWREEPPGQIVERQGDRYVLNRSEFYRALKSEFEKYVGAQEPYELIAATPFREEEGRYREGVLRLGEARRRARTSA